MKGKLIPLRVEDLLEAGSHADLTLPDELLYLPPMTQQMHDGVLQQSFQVIYCSPTALDNYPGNLFGAHFPSALQGFNSVPERRLKLLQ
jgi:hypothetical protein